MDGIKLLTDLFANVPDVDADVGRAGEGRIAEFSTGIKSMAAAAGLPPGHLEIVSVGFSNKPAMTPLPASEVDVEADRSEREALVEEIANTLGHFTGTTEWHRWSILFRKDLLTDGTKYLADKAGCYWLMDLIASVQNLPKVKREEFQVWYVVVCHAPFTQPRPWQWGPDNTELEECSGRWAWVWCEDGRDKENSVCYTQLVPFTDFPLANIETQRQPPARDPDRERNAFKLYANRNELGGITILLPSEY